MFNHLSVTIARTQGKKVLDQTFRSVCLVVVLSFFNSTSSAQETRFGIKAGMNYSTIVGDLTEGINPRFSGHFGGFVSVRYSRKFALRPELLYSSQGFQFNTDLAFIEGGGTDDGNDFKTAVQSNYLTVPLLGDFSLNDRFSLQFGPQFGFLLNEVTKLKNFEGLDGGALDEKRSVNGDFELDYGVAAGVSYHLNEEWAVSGRIYQGVRNRLNNGAGGDVQNFNTVFQVSLNYLFR